MNFTSHRIVDSLRGIVQQTNRTPFYRSSTATFANLQSSPSNFCTSLVRNRNSSVFGLGSGSTVRTVGNYAVLVTWPANKSAAYRNHTIQMKTFCVRKIKRRTVRSTLTYTYRIAGNNLSNCRKLIVPKCPKLKRNRTQRTGMLRRLEFNMLDQSNRVVDTVAADGEPTIAKKDLYSFTK